MCVSARLPLIGSHLFCISTCAHRRSVTERVDGVELCELASFVRFVIGLLACFFFFFLSPFSVIHYFDSLCVFESCTFWFCPLPFLSLFESCTFCPLRIQSHRISGFDVSLQLAHGKLSGGFPLVSVLFLSAHPSVAVGLSVSDRVRENFELFFT